jgi:hypothetical protein
MKALAAAMHRAIESRRHRRQRHRGRRSRYHRLDHDPGGRASGSPSTTTISGATIAPGRKPRNHRAGHARGASRPSTGAAASTPPSGASPSCCTGCATIPRSAAASRRRWSIATWWPPCCAASHDPALVPRSVCAMGHKWMWNAALGGLPPEEFLAGGRSAAGRRARQTGRPLRHFRPDRRPSARPNGPRGSACAPASPFPWAPSTRIGTPSARACGWATWSTWWEPPPASWPWGEAGADSRCVRRGGGLHRPASHRHRSRPVRHRRHLRSHRAARRHTVAELSRGLENYRAGETGLLRLTWDNGDRTVLVNPELSGVTLGWRLTDTRRRTNCSRPSKARPSTRA